MTLAELIQRVKLQVPNTNEAGITNANITLFLNQAVDQVNLFTQVYKTSSTFDIQAEKDTYEISEVIPTYLGISKEGLFFLNSDSQWKDIIPKTLPWLSETYPDFLNSSSVPIPQWYYVDGDILGFHPKPSTTQTNGAKLYHLKKSNPMTADNHYPFTGTETQITAFTPLDDAIIAYVKWKLSPAFGQVTDADLRREEFIDECRRGAKQIKRRKDLMHDSATRMRH
jgi:hypothetical protein